MGSRLSVNGLAEYAGDNGALSASLPSGGMCSSAARRIHRLSVEPSAPFLALRTSAPNRQTSGYA
ncbi:hypothetical protein JFPO14_contig00014-0144 [Edwardsiella piscicida]|nr:hypothetical protein HI13_contig00027-0023 [Edwardsiella piscicida]GBK54112.1 hypothetical protein JFPO13_contig00006-0144 [Edwardsiella piscicida]GBK58947.1 hypothetical protein JFPO14_contig00014-0144 [Edwardsiella piscicida]